MPASRLDVLLIPVSGPKGSGEAQAALLIAHALLRERTDLQVCVALAADSPLAKDPGVPTLLLPDSPTRCNDRMVEFIRARAPRVVVFDSTCRRRQQAAARDVGAHCIFVCWRAKSRRRALALDKLFHWTAIWLQSPPAAEDPLSPWEKAKLALPGAPPLSCIGPIGDRADASGAAALLPGDWHGRPWVLLCPGGRYGVELFRALADRLVADGHRVVLSCHAAPRAPSSGTLVELPRLPNALLLGLVTGAQRCVVNGGGLLLQAIALGKRPLAVPLARDQAARIRRLARLDLCEAADGSDPDALGRQLMRQPAVDPRQQHARARKHQLDDGLAEATERLQRLLDTPVA